MRTWSRFLVAWATLLLAPAGGLAADLQGQDWMPVDAAVRAQIAAGRLPGAVLVYGDADRVLLRRAWGRRAIDPEPESMTVDTVFDLASLTKVVATTTAVLQLAERGRLDLDRPAAGYWPRFGTRGKETITLRQLLAHRSGLRADLDLRGAWSGREEALRRVTAESPVGPPGTRTLYSDLNFIVLGEIVSRVARMPLETYVRREILAPARMRDTGFLPAMSLRSRIAPTEKLGTRPLRGVVHDPTARRMGGVAGHAGLFGPADDLARFAQHLLRHRLLTQASLEALQQIQGDGGEDDPRGLGWQLQAPLVANRDDLAPHGAIAHTGYTGTGMWIDLVQKRFVVLLSNRVHPDGRGDVRPLRRQVIALLSSLAAPIDAPLLGQRAQKTGIETGIDVLRSQGYQQLRGHRIALVTHLAALDRLGWRTLDRLRWAPGVTLVKVFTPEHGLGGDVEGPVASGTEPFSGLPLISLYGTGVRLDASTLQDIDTVVFDLQDAGVRFFTYISTLAETMEAAAEQRLRFVVLDRPNPIRADRVRGPVLDPGRESFTGPAALPVQHGMTVGELAGWFRESIRTRRGFDLDLTVVAMRGYRRDMWPEETGLDWVPPSPNLRTPLTALLYPGVAWIEGANVSVGRGTDHPFEWLGAPWIDAPRLASALEDASMPGLRIAPADFVPRAGPYRNQLCHGVRIAVSDRERLDAPLLGALLVRTLSRLWPAQFDVARTRAIVASATTSKALEEGADLASVVDGWRPALDAFIARRGRYLLY